jgi:hypothetical protein
MEIRGHSFFTLNPRGLVILDKRESGCKGFERVPDSLAKTEELIELIYAVLLGEASWPQFLDAVVAGVPLGRAVMVMHGIAEPEQGYVRNRSRSTMRTLRR